MKKGQLSFNTIVIAILAVAVLIAVIMFFSGRFAQSAEAIDTIDQTSEQTTYVSCKLSCDFMIAKGDTEGYGDKCECFEALNICGNTLVTKTCESA